MCNVKSVKCKVRSRQSKTLKTKSFFPAVLFYFCIFYTLHITLYTFAETVKEPNVAGTFYPADKGELVRLIRKFLDGATVSVSEKDPLILVSPHAGYIYSGQVAGYGYKALSGKKFDTVVILAPSHFFSLTGYAVYPKGAFRTPLGDIAVDEESVDRFWGGRRKNIEPYFLDPRYFEQEHSVEVQLPFLQMSLAPGFKIIPILLGDMTYQQCSALAETLKGLAASNLQKSFLVVASTDLSHYLGYEEANALDGVTLTYLRDLDAEGLWRAVAHTGWNVCGAKPVVTALLYAKLRSAAAAEILKYANSGDTAGDKNRVVGYTSAVVWQAAERSSIKEAQRGENMLTKEERRRLLDIARRTLEANLAGGKASVFEEKEGALTQHRGVFVTLHNGAELRGCIGNLTSTEPLYQAVSRMAVESATSDHRFSPVSQEELKSISIEISVMTEPKPIEDWRQIRLGTDGVIVRRGSSSGVFLPQVATETGWDLETFLSQLCFQKAGLPSDCYRDPATKIYTFQAEVFSEQAF